MYYRLEIPNEKGEFVGAVRPVRAFSKVWERAVQMWEHGHSPPPIHAYADPEAITGTESMDMLRFWFPNLDEWEALGARVMQYSGRAVYTDHEQVVFIPESGHAI